MISFQDQRNAVDLYLINSKNLEKCVTHLAGGVEYKRMNNLKLLLFGTAAEQQEFYVAYATATA